MNAKQIVKGIMRMKGVSQERLGRSLGLNGQSAITNILNRGQSIRVDRLEELLAPLGYKVMIVPEGTEVSEGYDVHEKEDKA